MRIVSCCAAFLLPTALADLDAVAVDIEHILERVRIGRIEEADHVNKILEVGVERIGDDQIVPTWKN